ncbi:hypothetical protein JG687_00015336 [Phytophthora cactorum]|uniref:Uncharacterized protein n=1 Tax=Phytophthora cactorum TaxID=29920 RepID=A0A8T1TTM3_9STRA|nr:hypothetical protein JG687_00015336 [Phytophthora cactorum]
MPKLKTQTLVSLKQKLERDVLIGSDRDNLAPSTVAIYVRQLLKLFKSGLDEYSWSHDEFIDRIHYPRMFDDTKFQNEFKVQNSDMISLLRSVYKSKETLILTLNALCKMTKNRFKQIFDYYNRVRKELSKQNKSEKLDNELTPEEEAKYISYDELMAIPVKVKSDIIRQYGNLLISKGDFDVLHKSKRNDYLLFLFEYITRYLNVHYPLRLVWPTVRLEPVEGENYLQGNNLYLNDFKNVRLMGPQVIDIDSSTMQLIKQYLQFLTDPLGQTLAKLLWRVYNGRAGEYDYTSNKTGGFSQMLSRIFVKYNKKLMSMNMIRNIVESNLIQSPQYSTMTNRAKNDLHAKLLHSSYAANISYNKISNRSKDAPLDF